VNWGRSQVRRLSRVVPPAVVLVALGVTLLGLSLTRLFLRLREVMVLGGPMLAAWGNASLSLVVIYVGYRLSRSDYDTQHRWTITGGALLGTVIGIAIQSYAFVIRIAEGRPLDAPIFPIVLLAAVGALGGAAIAVQYVNTRIEAERAREARDAMAFTNSLLRHDIRNGLQIVRSHAELVEKADDDRLQRSGAAIDRQVDSLNELIKEVRAVSTVLLEEAEPEPIDLSTMLTDVVATARESHPAATFELDVPDRTFVAGTQALVPVFTNLLNNAVQHTSADATVRVTAEHGGDSVVATVADDGPGIPEAERDRVFERGVSDEDGGLGLHIVATIIERSGGSVRIEESKLGGAAFVVTLPEADVEAERS
jgi:signal transduction histidine kinase